MGVVSALPAAAASIRRRRRARRSGTLLLSAALSVVMSMSVLSPAHADPLSSPTVARDWEADDRVWAVVDTGDVIYAGGRFTSFTDPDGVSVSRTRLAAIDPVTGAPLALDVPVDGEVRALELSADGLTLYIGGVFRYVAGEKRKNAAAISTVTGELTAWEPKPNRAVLAIETKGNTAYIGGKFTKLAGVAGYQRIAATDATTGAALSGFAASADRAVTDLQLSATEVSLLVAGNFKDFNGTSTKHLARVNLATGAMYDWATVPGAPLLDIAVEGGTVFGAGRGGGGTMYAFDVATGTRLWYRRADGDVQAVAVSGGVVYGGGHFQELGDDVAQHVFAVSASDGENLFWDVRTNSVLGVWAITASPERVVLGGDFTRVNYRSRTAHLARIT